MCDDLYNQQRPSKVISNLPIPQMRNFGTGSLSEAGQDGGVSPEWNSVSTWKGASRNSVGIQPAVFNVWKRSLFWGWMNRWNARKALFWKDIWRRSKSDSAIVIVRYNSVLFVVYLTLLHIDRLSRKAFASTGSSIFCYILTVVLTCQISFLRVVSKKSFNLTTWGSTATSESCRDHSEVPVGPFWRGPEAGFTVYTWLKFYILHAIHFVTPCRFLQLLSSSLGF